MDSHLFFSHITLVEKSNLLWDIMEVIDVGYLRKDQGLANRQ